MSTGPGRTGPLLSIAVGVILLTIVVVWVVRRPRAERHISLAQFLQQNRFVGVRLGYPPGSPADASFAKLAPTGDAVTITFGKADARHRGRYDMLVGRHRVSGEWNLYGPSVHLWIDDIDGKLAHPSYEPLEITFMAPRFVDDPITAQCVGESPTSTKTYGVYVLRNSRQEKYLSGPNASLPIVIDLP